MPDDELKVTRKKVDDMLVASIRFIGLVEEIPETLKTLIGQVKELSSGQPLALFYPSSHLKGKDDVEVCVPVSEPVEAKDLITRKLEGGEFITTLYHGPQEADKAWNGLFAYINKNNIHVRAPSREVYLVQNPADPSGDVTELQFPIIEKA